MDDVVLKPMEFSIRQGSAVWGAVSGRKAPAMNLFSRLGHWQNGGLAVKFNEPLAIDFVHYYH